MTDTNDEKTVHCPVEGCDATPLARGLHLHVWQSCGGGHGPRGDVPDHLTLDTDTLEAAGEREVTMDYPDERETEQVSRLCPYCEQPFSGTNGVLIHLGQVAGRKNHPEDAAENHSEDDFPQIETDEHGNVTGAIDSVADPSTDASAEIPRERVYRLVAELIADGEYRIARRVRRALIGSDDAVAPSRDDLAAPDLFEALLRQGRAEKTDHRVSVALEGEAVIVTCRGESARLRASDAREIASRVEHVATSESWHDADSKELIGFLRSAADVLDGNKSERSLHEEFNHWR